MRLICFSLFVALGKASLVYGNIPKDCKKDPNTPDCEEKYLTSVCYPGGDSKNVDFGAPCNAKQYILYSCLYGVKPNITEHGIDIDAANNDSYQSNSTQRLCLCESPYWDTLEGCDSCFRKHGGGPYVFGNRPTNVINSMSQAYCAATATPTLAYPVFVVQYLQKQQFSTLFDMSSASSSTTASFSDPLASSTAVSLYYTAAVTGSEALDVGVFTESGTAKPTTTLVREGQIVATASTIQEATTTTSTHTTGAITQNGSSNRSTTTTSGIGSKQTQAAVAGLFGLVGAVALL